MTDAVPSSGRHAVGPGFGQHDFTLSLLCSLVVDRGAVERYTREGLACSAYSGWQNLVWRACMDGQAAGTHSSPSVQVVARSCSCTSRCAVESVCGRPGRRPRDLGPARTLSIAADGIISRDGEG
ncbi:hypothetical protein LIA77_03730 [Sarocladium implicatum]|nr:hypothetical protein LIA77_03730 [Sarocladium implicatum]